MAIITGTNDNFESEVLKSDKPVLVDFNATWCPPCQALHPILEDLASEAEDFKIVAVDVDEAEELARKYEVSSIPCLVVFKNGTETERAVGLRSKKSLREMIGD